MYFYVALISVFSQIRIAIRYTLSKTCLLYDKFPQIYINLPDKFTLVVTLYNPTVPLLYKVTIDILDCCIPQSTKYLLLLSF